MHSAGGLVSPAAARAFPIRLLESGPAGGGLATALFGELAGKPDALAFDMGGTTAKACLIENGRAEIAAEMEAGRTHRFKKGSGLPIKAPTIDMIEIGAGGGSIASIDEVGLLRVGPHSAGASPGPACYGRGGTEATVTDANLLLGYYDPGFFLGGRMTLDVEAARKAVAELGGKLGLSVEETAHGIRKVVIESMAAAARVHLVEKGKDPRHYAMVGFGGAGPAHAAEVARALGVREVIVPPASGAASALGFLAAPLYIETVRSHPVEFTAPFDAAALAGLLSQLEAPGRALLQAAGVAPADVAVERSADIRVVGQMHEIAVKLPDGALTQDRVEKIRNAFTAAYAARYTAPPAGARFEAINFRVRCSGPAPKLSLRGAVGGAEAPKRKGTRQAWFAGAWHDAPVLDRYALAPGDEFAGPAIVEEREATTILAPGDRMRVDDALNLRIEVAQSTAAPARITRETPVEDAIRLIESDPIGLEIMWSRLVTVVEEMWWTVCRTAFSLVISEAQDFACELLDPQGEPLAHSPRAMPFFNQTLPRAVKAMLAAYPPATLQPGDVLVTNDPWLCAGHLFDIAVVTPVFHEGRLIALMGTVGHVSDIGGARDSLRVREIFDEGFQIPPLKLMERGQPNATLWRLLQENVRNPDQVPEGGVLVVGAAASGIQIADELLRAGRDVTVAVGEHVRVPRRYRGADILWWMEGAGVLGEPWTEMDDLVRARSIPSMQLTGGGDTLDLNALTARGARLVGRLQAVRDGRLLFSGSLRNVCALADLKLERLLDTLDAWAEREGLDAPPPERLPRTEVPDAPVTELSLGRDGIRSVLWATGYRAELTWLEAPVLNPRGRLIHDGGVTRVPGLYLMGMPCLRRRKSTLIDGADADAADITAHLATHLDAVVRGEGVPAAG